MKKIYLAPALRERVVDTCLMLCVSGGVDGGSISKEDDEDMPVKRSGSYSTNSVKWDDWD